MSHPKKIVKGFQDITGGFKYDSSGLHYGSHETQDSNNNNYLSYFSGNGGYSSNILYWYVILELSYFVDSFNIFENFVNKIFPLNVFSFKYLACTVCWYQNNYNKSILRAAIQQKQF